MPVSISASTVADGRIPNGGICGDPIRSPGKNTNPDSNNATSRNPRETLRCKGSSSPGRIVVRSQPNSAEIGLASFTIDCVAEIGRASWRERVWIEAIGEQVEQ